MPINFCLCYRFFFLFFKHRFFSVLQLGHFLLFTAFDQGLLLAILFYQFISVVVKLSLFYPQAHHEFCKPWPKMTSQVYHNQILLINLSFFGETAVDMFCEAFRLGVSCQVLKLWHLLNPLSPNGDRHQFSPNDTNTLSRDWVMRINKMITKNKML